MDTPGSQRPSTSKYSETETEHPAHEINTHYKYHYYLKNIPNSWNTSKIRKFVLGIINSKRILQNMILTCLKKNPVSNNSILSSKVLLKFKDMKTVKIAIKKLQNIEVKGKHLTVTKVQLHSSDNVDIDKPKTTLNRIYNYKIKLHNIPPSFYREEFTHETYGLSTQFLNQLNISPPLSPSIYVKNLQDFTKRSKVMEIFSLAGKILQLSMKKYTEDNVSKRSAKILYDHPVEAVQAISMFNNQILFGNKLDVCMTTESKFNANLMPPLGMDAIGPGLGENAEPLQNVRLNMSIEKIKKYMQDFCKSLNIESREYTTIDSCVYDRVLTNELYDTIIKTCSSKAFDFNKQRQVWAMMALHVAMAVVNIQNRVRMTPFQNLFSTIFKPPIFVPVSEYIKQPQSQAAEQCLNTIADRTAESSMVSLQHNKRCYKCGQAGHEANECTAGPCSICKKSGHSTQTCWYAAGPSTSQHK